MDSSVLAILLVAIPIWIGAIVWIMRSGRRERKDVGTNRDARGRDGNVRD